MTQKELFTTGFDKICATYPRKAAFPRAARIWSKLRPDEILLNKMLLALECQKSFWAKEKTPKKYIPLLANWLKDERWNDEPDEEVIERIKQINLTEEEVNRNLGL
jgi:hypothetical protein